MLDLFNCRNCIHNCSQTAHIGNGAGYCLQHESVLLAPEDTTCKYLFRKDLPKFVVDEAIGEHAQEYAYHSGLVSLSTGKSLPTVRYSEKNSWEQKSFDVVINTLAQLGKTERTWVFIEAFSGGVDGRRALTSLSLMRRYMNKCDTWTSSYRLLLAALQELDQKPQFSKRDLVESENQQDFSTIQNDALWDVLFVRLAAIQEYGFHAGKEELMWASDTLGDAFATWDWQVVQPLLLEKKTEWTNLIMNQAVREGVFFPPMLNELRESPGVS